MKSTIAIRPVVAQDSEVITGIYNHYILNTVITFEEEQLTTDVMRQRIAKVQMAGLPWLVAVDNSKRQPAVLGYAYAQKWHERSAYRFSAECSVYLEPSTGGQGIGSALYLELMQMIKDSGYTVAIGCLTLPNQSSEILHEKLGMHKVAHFENVGYKNKQWHDVGYWQKAL